MWNYTFLHFIIKISIRKVNEYNRIFSQQNIHELIMNHWLQVSRFCQFWENECNTMPQQIPTSKLKFFQREILNWYLQNGRKFLWRKKGLSNYQYIIAEVLLQRTKADTVHKFYPRFIIDYPNWQALANAELSQIELHLKPICLERNGTEFRRVPGT